MPWVRTRFMKLLADMPHPLWEWVGLVAVWSLLFSPALYRLARLGLENDDYSHVGLIPLIFAGLLWHERHRLSFSSDPVPAAFFGLCSLILLVPVLPDFTGPETLERLSLQIAAFVVGVTALFVWRCGTHALLTASFPFFMLLFFVPLPSFLLQPWIDLLLWGSTHTTDFFFRLSAVPYLQEGTRFLLPNVAIEIAEQCSGIRSTMALVITGLLAGRLFLRRFWTRGLLIALLFPLAMFKNGLRIATLTLLSIRVDPGFLEGDLHRRGGIVFFLIALLVMVVIIRLLQKIEDRSVRGTAACSAEPGA